MCFKSSILEDSELPVFFLLLALIVKTKDCLVHNTGEKENLFDFLFLGDPAKLILECDGYLCFEEFFLLLSGRHM
jgi:hypothetical protein